MRTKEQIVDLVQGAFAPLECVAELSDYRTKIGFRVYGVNDQPILKFEPIPIHQLASGQGLVTIIEAARRRVEERGIALAPWTMPHL